MKKGLRILLGIVIVLVLLGVLAFFFVGSIVKAGVEKVGPRVAGVPVHLDSAQLSILGGSGKLKGFVLGNPEGFKTPEAMRVGTIDLAVAPKSIFADKKVVRHIRVEAPELTYETDLKGSNLGKLLENVKGSASQDQAATNKNEQATKTKLQVDEFLITGAIVHVSVNAAMLGGQSASVTLPEIRLTNLGQGPDGITPAELSSKVLSAVLDATTKAVAENVGKVTEGVSEATKALGTTASDQLKKAGSGVSDLLKKKKP